MEDKEKLERIYKSLFKISELTDEECEQFEGCQVNFGTMVKVRFFTVDNEPNWQEPIVFVTANGRVHTFRKLPSSWRHYVDKFKIKYWAYARDIVSGLVME